MTEAKAESQADLPIMNGPSGVLAAAGAIVGMLGLGLALLDMGPWRVGVRAIGVEHPPSLLAVNISFCSLFMGVAGLYRVRRMPRQTVTRMAAMAAVLMGLAGPMVFSLQSAQYRRVRAEAEVGNVEAIVRGARAYAMKHGGTYARDLEMLLGAGLVNASDLQSPYMPVRPSPWPDAAKRVIGVGDVVAWRKIAAESDYLYVGGDLTESMVASADGAALVVVFAKTPRDRVALTVGFADGRAVLLPEEKIEGVRAACDAARGRAGLKPLAEVQPTTEK